MPIENFNTSDDASAEIMRGRTTSVDLSNNIPKNRVTIEKIYADGTVELLSDGYNSRTNSGAAAQANIMGDATGNPFNWIALSSTVLTPSATDTTLAGEITGSTNSGLARAQGSYINYTAPASLGASASYQIQNTFTSSGTTVVNSAALFDASTGGNLFVESNISPSASLASGDSIRLTWMINI